MTMSVAQQMITIAMVVFGTMFTRFLPFVVFSAGKPTPEHVQYLGKVLPSGSHGIPQLMGVAVVALLHVWKKKMFLSIVGGTIVYMILVQTLFQ